MKMTKIALAAVLAMGATVANAAGAYVELGLGSVDGNSTTTPAIPATSSVSRDTALSIGLGYKLNDRFGLEAGYSNAGSGSATSTFTAAFGARSAGDVVRGDSNVSAFYFGGNVTFPLTDKIDVIGRAGLSNWEVEYSGVTLNGTAIATPASIDGSDPYYGLGIAYKLNDQMSLGFGWMRQEASYSVNGYSTKSEIDITSANLRYNF